jgi:hypothetical protein
VTAAVQLASSAFPGGTSTLGGVDLAARHKHKHDAAKAVLTLLQRWAACAVHVGRHCVLA